MSGIERVIDGGCTLIRMNRPEHMNALDKQARFAMAVAIDDFLDDASQHVAIITGTGTRAFSAGLDLKELDATEGALPPMPASGFGGMTSRVDVGKPVIAAVNGLAAGGGFELALACDIAICTPDAWFCLPEPDVGLVAMAGGLVRLARAVGERRALEIAMTRRRVGAAEARDLGLVVDIVSPEDLVRAAFEIASGLRRASPRAIRATRVVLRNSIGMGLAEALAMQNSVDVVRDLLESDDPQEGGRAFAERRLPVWSV